MSDTIIHPNNLLKRERNLQGWSFRDVADRIECPDVRLVRRWEHGDIFPGTHYRQKLCQLFGKNAEELGLLKEFYRLTPGEQQKAPDPVSSGASLVSPSSSETTVQDTNRQRMIERVRHFWIKGLLDHSLDTAELITLEMHEDLEAGISLFIVFCLITLQILIYLSMQEYASAR